MTLPKLKLDPEVIDGVPVRYYRWSSVNNDKQHPVDLYNMEVWAFNDSLSSPAFTSAFQEKDFNHYLYQKGTKMFGEKYTLIRTDTNFSVAFSKMMPTIRSTCRAEW